MSDRKETRYEFGPFTVVVCERALFKAGEPVPLTPKEFETLHVLLREAGRLVSKAEIIKQVWPDTFVSDGSLSRNISVLRKALGNGYIWTIPKAGYRFVEAVKVSEEAVVSFYNGKGSGAGSTSTKAASASFQNGNSAPSGLESGDQAGADASSDQAPLGAPEATSAQGIVEATPPRAQAANSGRKLAYAIGVLASLLLFVLVLARSSLFRSSIDARKFESTPSIRLLVLPVENLTGTPDQEYLADGLTDEIIASLGKVSPDSLQVIGPATAGRLKGASESPQRMGEKLHAAYAVVSSLAQQDGRIRLSAQLVRVSDGAQVWGADYEREDQKPFGIPNEIALSVANGLHVRPSRTGWNEGTTDTEAHEDYLKGRFFWNKRLKEDVLTAIDYFSRAISRDPNYARPYAGLADSYIVMAGHHLPAQTAYVKAQEYAERAVLLDGTLAEAHTSLAYIMYGQNWDWAGAEREYKRALALDPEYAIAHHWYFIYLTAMKRLPEAIRETEKALALDPLSQSINYNAGTTYLVAHQYDRAERQLRGAVELDPSNPVAYGYLGFLHVEERKYDFAEEEFERARVLETEKHNYDAALAGAYAKAGRLADANKLAQDLAAYSKTHWTDPYWFVTLYAALGDRDKTLLWVDAAVKAHSCTALDINADPWLDFVRSDPRFQQIIFVMHLPR